MDGLLSYLTLFVYFYTTTSAIPTLPTLPNILELNPHISPFEPCNLRIIINDVGPPSPKKSEFEHGSYELLPTLSVPVMLSKYFHTFQGERNDPAVWIDKKNGLPAIPEKDEYMHCDKYRYSLSGPPDFQHQIKRQPKLNCAVVIYVEPYPCKVWFHRYDTYSLAVVTKEFIPEDFPLPRSLLDTLVYDHDHETNLAKSHLLLIHARKSEPYRKKVVAPKHDFLYIVDQIYRFWAVPLSPLVVLFLVSNNPRTSNPILNSTNIVIGKILEECVNYESSFNFAFLASLNYKSYEGSFWARKKDLEDSLKLRASKELPMDGDLNIDSIHELRAECPQNVWIGCHQKEFGSTNEARLRLVEQKKLTTYYLLDWQDGAEMLQVDNILLKSIFPNSSYRSLGARIPHMFALFFPGFQSLDNHPKYSSFTYTDKYQNLNFVTCVPLKQSSELSLRGYISAFQGPVWATFLVFAVFSGVVVHTLRVITAYRNVKNKDIHHKSRVALILRELCKREGFDNLTFAYNIFVLQTTRASTTFKWIGATWLLAGVVLSNAYLGENIHDLTNPRPPKKYERFEQLFEDRINFYSPIADFVSNLVLQVAHQADFLRNLTLSGPTKGNPKTIGLERSVRQQLQILLDEAVNYTAFGYFPYLGHLGGGKQINVKKLKELLVIPTTVEGHVELLQPNYLLKRISRCRQEVYVSKMEELLQFELKLRRKLILDGGGNSKILSIGKEPFPHMPKAWAFLGIDWPATKFSRRVRTVFHSGILKLWREWAIWRNTYNDTVFLTKTEKPKNQFRPVSLKNANTAAMFYFHGGILLIPLFVFAAEMCGKWKLMTTFTTAFISSYHLWWNQMKIFFAKVSGAA